MKNSNYNVLKINCSCKFIIVTKLTISLLLTVIQSYGIDANYLSTPEIFKKNNSESFGTENKDYNDIFYACLNPGVNVLIKGTLIGTITDVNGEYSIDVQNPEVVSASNALAGQATGLIAVQSSGQPGADEASLNIRGFDSPHHYYLPITLTRAGIQT